MSSLVNTMTDKFEAPVAKGDQMIDGSVLDDTNAESMMDVRHSSPRDFVPLQPYRVDVGGGSRFVADGIMSSYVLPGMIPTIEAVDSIGDQWVMCVGYCERDGGDAQVGITGSKKGRETSVATGVREVREEAGLDVDPRALNEVAHARAYGKTFTSFRVKSTDVTVPMRFQARNCDRDDKRVKSQVLIHGPHDQMCHLAESGARELLRAANPDNIAYILIISASVALSVAHHMEQQRKAKIMPLM